MDLSISLWVSIGAVCLGAILGSFVNALASRFNTGQSIMRGRSHCDRCNHMLSALDLVPIFSYLFLGGRCRYCKTKIPGQDPVVEIVAALTSFLIYLQFPYLSAYAFWLLVWMTILFIVVYDMRHTIIPPSCAVFLGALAVLSLFFSFETFSFVVPSVWALAAGPTLALPLFLFSFLSGGRWMGWGDWSFELSLGWLLGLSVGASALMLAFWSGAAAGIFLLLFSKIPWGAGQTRFTMRSEVPFAPFLALGAFVALFFHVNFFSSIFFW